MARIFLTHIPDMLRNYYGPRAVEALRKLGEVRINPGEEVLDAAALVKAAQGCEIIVSDRQTPGPPDVFAQSPDLVAFLRCAVDIRNIDVAAASQAGVLVTQATPGFAVSVAEMAVGIHDRPVRAESATACWIIGPAASRTRVWAASSRARRSASWAMA